MTDWSATPGDPWSVTFRPVGDGRVVRLHVGNFTVVLPALEAHKLGSALHAASGLETEPGPVPALREACPECNGTGCSVCEGRGWRINPEYLGDEDGDRG